MNTLFISDLHLGINQPKTTDIFLKFLQHDARQAEAIYILGDLFEIWIGDDDTSEFNQKIINALKQAVAGGTPIYFMHGNRDLLISKKFLQASGCRLLNDPTCIDLYGIPTLLTHGDLLCVDDAAYQRFRTIMHFAWVQKLLLLLPLAWRQKIAAPVRQHTQKHAGQKDPRIMDANLNAAKRMLQQHNAKLLIHGHTHRPSIQHFKLDNDLACRIVLSDWHEQGNVLICQENGERRLVGFK